MKKGGSKQKGSSFEREIAVVLSKWISQGLREDLLWRSSMSGGRATVGRKKGLKLDTVIGDLCAVHSDGEPFLSKFYVELKHYKDLNFPGLITSTGNLTKFWDTAVTEANFYKRHPMLIGKQNRLPIVVFLQVSGLHSLGLNENQAVLSSPRKGMYGYLLVEFVKWANPP